MLAFGLAVAVGPEVSDRVWLHIKAKQFLRVKKLYRFTHQPPGTTPVVIQSQKDVVLCFVGAFRIAVLGGRHTGSTALQLPIAGDTPKEMARLPKLAHLLC